MQYKIRSIFTLFFLMGVLVTTAQSRFNAPDTIKFLVKDTSFGTLHEFLEIKNKTADSLQMRWKQRKTRYTSGWKTTLQDPDQWHNPVDGVDSADFTLPDTLSGPFNNKLIIGVDHNGIAGGGMVVFTVFEIGHPQDSVRLYFDILVTPKVGLAENQNGFLKVYPQPARDQIKVKASGLSDQSKIYLTSLSGQEFLVPYQYTGVGTWQLETQTLPPGVYILSVVDKDHLYHQKVYLH